MKAKADKKKEKEIMNFDWPSETKRKEERRAAKGKGKEEANAEDDSLDGLREGEHFNFWAGVEKTASVFEFGEADETGAEEYANVDHGRQTQGSRRQRERSIYNVSRPA